MPTSSSVTRKMCGDVSPDDAAALPDDAPDAAAAAAAAAASSSPSSPSSPVGVASLEEAVAAGAEVAGAVVVAGAVLAGAELDEPGAADDGAGPSAAASSAPVGVSKVAPAMPCRDASRTALAQMAQPAHRQLARRAAAGAAAVSGQAA